ncbi:site-specific integrase [Hymenobacter armeniacus]|uniref:Site-specific integrase n=1 Tax=Hymenobacter armeniacus TaxID=2771358 RepID=A0ABR8JQG4_9BACT|nr:site-specific integrase [Hymenobacter armeniacus]MBD2722205.1 site-specific integrase [Hymenobacter armeniacus]
MVSITFFLKEPRQDRPTPLIARLAFQGQKVKVYVGLKVEPRKWIQAAQQFQTRGNNQAGRLNDMLAAMRTRLENYYLDAIAAGTLPTAEQLRQAIEPELTPAEAPAPPLAAEVEPEAPAGPGLLAAYLAWDVALQHQVRPATRASNATTYKHICHFQERSGYRVDFDTMTPVFAAQFCTYLLNEVGLTDNSLAKILTRLKAFLRYAHEHGLTERADFRFIKWKRREPDILTLTLAELRDVEQLDLTDYPGLANARDLFLLACYTGLRYSDLVSLRPEHLQGERLRLRTLKTRELVTIPLRPEARCLLASWFAGTLYKVSNVGLNVALKEVGQRAGLNAVVERVRYRGALRQTETFRKWQLISCHTARRTFVTLALEQKIRPEVVMKVTGHSSWATFRRYVSISERTVEQEFAAVYGASESPEG